MADTDVIQKAFSFGYTWAKLVSWWESVGAGKKCTFSLLNWPFDFSHRSATHTKESQAGGLVRDQCLVCRDWQLKVPAACPSQLQISENWEWFFYLLSLFFHPISLTRVFRGKGHCPQNGNGVPVGGWRRHHSPSLMGPTITKTSQEVLCHHTFSFTPVYPMDLGWVFFCLSKWAYIWRAKAGCAHMWGCISSWGDTEDELIWVPWYVFHCLCPHFGICFLSSSGRWEPLPQCDLTLRYNKIKTTCPTPSDTSQYGWLGWAEQRANAQ